MSDSKEILAQVRANVDQATKLLDQSNRSIMALLNERRQLPSAWIELHSELEEATDSPLRLADYWLAQLEPLPVEELCGVSADEEEVQP